MPRFTYEIRDAPVDMTVSTEGILEWYPDKEDVGTRTNITLIVTASWDDFEPSCRSFPFTLQVVDYFPKLADRPEPIIIYEGPGIGSSGTFLEELDDSRKELRWSLIDPPLGISISEEGNLSWDTSIGTGSAEPLTVRIRAEYDTPTETLSDEVSMTYYLLGTPPKDNWSTFRAQADNQKEGALMGWDLEQAGDWLIASEPFTQNHPDPGSVRLWRKQSNGGWGQTLSLQPHIQQNYQKFGASVSLSVGPEREILAVGAPGLNRHPDFEGGAIYLYEKKVADFETDLWSPGELLTIPESSADMRLGASVDLDQETLVASAQGHRGENYDTDSGAFFIFNRSNTEGWTLVQEILNPDPSPAADLFGYPCALDGSWIAVSATQDDELGEDSGAIYLYQKEAAEWILKQKLHSTIPSPDERFGSRLCLSGDWLFVGTPHASEDHGKVEIFRLTGDTWVWHQTLTEFLTDDPQFFGAAIDRKGDTLTISSPGGFSFMIDDEPGEHSSARISVFRLENGLWKLDRFTYGSGGHHENPNWGHDLALMSEDAFVASHPTYPYKDDGKPMDKVGRIFEYSWTNEVDDWEAFRTSHLPGVDEELTADGDSDRNSISNLMEWVWGLDPLSSRDNYGLFDKRFYVPFVDLENKSRPRLMLPEIKKTTGFKLRVVSSSDLQSWTEVSPLEWGSPEFYYFQNPDGSRSGGLLSPILLPAINSPEQRFYRIEMSTE